MDLGGFPITDSHQLPLGQESLVRQSFFIVLSTTLSRAEIFSSYRPA
jgi:hypothetical protein